MPDKANSLPLGMTVVRLSRLVDHVLEEMNLSPSQYRMLVQLGEGADSSSTLAKKLAVSAPSVTAVVDGLVRRGAIARTSSEEDRRRIELTLTKEGRSLLRDTEKTIRLRMEQLAAELDDELLSNSALASLLLWGEAIVKSRLRRAAAQIEGKTEAVQ